MDSIDNKIKLDFSKFEFLTLHLGQREKFLAACQTEDDIGVVLRLHLLLEKDLEAWCICATENENIFQGFGENLSLDFAAKAQLAHNLGLSEDLHKVIKRLNKVRNSRAHQVENFSITSSEIDSLSALVGFNYPPNLLEMDAFLAKIDDGPIYSFKSSETPLRIKFMMLFSMLKMRMCDEARRKTGAQL